MKKVDSRRNTLSVIASGACTAWQSTSTEKVDSSFKAMDRHADKSARDDRKTSNATNPSHTTQAARLKTSKATILNTHKGGRILRLESGLCKASAEIRLGRLSHKRAAAIHDSSPKQAKRSFFRKANAKRSKL